MVVFHPNMTDKKWNHHDLLSLSFSALQYVYHVESGEPNEVVIDAVQLRQSINLIQCRHSMSTITYTCDLPV